MGKSVTATGVQSTEHSALRKELGELGLGFFVCGWHEVVGLADH